LLALPLQRSGFNRFYQHFRWKSPIAGKTFAHKNKRPGTIPGSLFKTLKFTQPSSSDEDDGGDDDDGDGHTHSQEPRYQRERRLQWQQELTYAAS
jgi:hypothetical protein